MEKIKLNNQIVSMRKFIKQAKVHAINKLVKQIKLLQNRKGSEAQVQKAKRKADRFLEAVALLKKVKPDEVSKLALSKSKDWKNVLQQKNATLHDRCIAMLANYGAVQKEVEAFYYANKELVLKISDYIAQWEEKNRSSKDSSKTSKMLPEKKLIENVQKEKLRNESLSSSKKNKFKAVVRTESELDTVLKKSHEDKNIEVEISNNNDDDQIVKLQQASNYTNPIKNVKETKNLNNSDKSIETKESDSSDDEEMIGISIKNNSKGKDAVDSNNEDSDSSDDEEMIDISIKNNSKAKHAADSNNEESDNNDEKNEEMAEISLISNNKEDDTNDSSKEENNTNEVHKSMSKLDLPFKMNNNPKNKLKAIALLNLNELEGLDEIPVVSSFENKESDEDETSEDEVNEASQDGSTDPFFLGHNKGDSLQNKNTDYFFLGNKEDTNAKEKFLKESDTRIRDTVYSFKNRTQNAKSFLHRRKDGLSPDKSFQKYSYNHRNAQKNFKNEKKSAKSFKNEKFTSSNYNNKFQERNRSDFKLKSKFLLTKDTYDRKQLNTSRSYGNKDDNMYLKNKEPPKKSNASESLHPSWEAKRKQKELLSTSFQGKRMVFND